MREQGDAWDSVWAVISIVLGEATAFLTVYPTLHEVPGFTREGLALGFGLLLSATYFLMGVPCVGTLRKAVYWIIGKYHGPRQARPKES